MSKTIPVLLLCILCAALSVQAAGRHPGDVWNYYHFDGVGFSSGPALDDSPFLAVREKVRPAVVTSPTSLIEQINLPDGAGAVAGICYIQSSGGKLGGGNSIRPHPRSPLLVTSEDRPAVTVQTDDRGYFTAVLAAGTYSISSGAFSYEITVKSGITTLVPLRTGKRMVD